MTAIASRATAPLRAAMTKTSAARPLPTSLCTACSWTGRYPRRAAALKIIRTIRATTRPVGLSIPGFIPGMRTPLDRLPAAVAALDFFILARQAAISPTRRTQVVHSCAFIHKRWMARPGARGFDGGDSYRRGMGSCMGADEARERISAALDAIDAAHAVLRETNSDVVGNNYRVDVAERLETQDRANRGMMYRFFAEIADPPDGSGCAPAVRELLWARLRITRGEIVRRFKLAARIRPRRSLTGPLLPPELPELAAAVEAGGVGEDHIRAVCRAVDVLPASVSHA